jgi:integrase
MLRTFFGFCQARGWLSKDVDLLSRVEKRSGTQAEIEIFTHEELRKVLRAASPRVAACIAIQAFAGVRAAELFRLTWQDASQSSLCWRSRGGTLQVDMAEHRAAKRPYRDHGWESPNPHISVRRTHLGNHSAASGFVFPHISPWICLVALTLWPPSITQSEPPECEISGLTERYAHTLFGQRNGFSSGSTRI